MATYEVERAAHKTLTATTVDTIIMPSIDVRIMNRSGSEPLWVTIDGTEPVAGADDIYIVPANSWIELRASSMTARHSADSTTDRATIKVLGNGNQYTVEETW